MSDPRKFVRNILLGVTATKDDNTTPANILVFWQGSPDNFRRLFLVNGIDAVITVDRVNMKMSSADKQLTPQVPLRYDGEVPISTFAIDKTGITAAKLLNKVRLSIITQIEAAALGALVTVKVSTDRGAAQYMGGYDPMWQDSFTVTWRPNSSVGP